jgi:hypothetical protein
MIFLACAKPDITTNKIGSVIAASAMRRLEPAMDPSQAARTAAVGKISIP